MNKNCGFCREPLDHPLIHGLKFKNGNLIRSVFSKFFAGKEFLTRDNIITQALLNGNRKIRNQIKFLSHILSKGTILERLENDDMHDKYFNFILNFVKPKDLTEKNRNRQTVLHLALKNRLEQLALKILEQGVKIDEKDRWQTTPFHIACEQNFMKTVETLIHKNCDINAKNNKGFTGLDIAFQKNHIQLAKCLIQQGANFETTRTGLHPILLASKIGDLELLQLLLQKGANLFITNPQFHTNAFHYAAKYGHIHILKFLYKKNKNFLNQVDNEGWAAIHFSAHKGNFKTTKFLINLGAEKFMPDIYDQTPALLASYYNYMDIVDLFELSSFQKQILLKQNWHDKSNW
jgi:ankyrin repeat protein